MTWAAHPWQRSPRRRESRDAPDQVESTLSATASTYPSSSEMGMDAIVQHLDRLENQKDGLEEDIARILDDQSEAERDMAELRAEQDRYREKLEMALQKQQRDVDILLHLVEDMSGRLKRLEELQPLASGPELPARPAAAELVKRVKTLRGAMEKPMGGPAEAPYGPPRVDPGALPFVPMFSDSIMLGEHTAPAGSMREEHATTDLRSLTVQMSHAARDPPTAMTAHAVYAEEEIQTMQGRTMGRADRHGRDHSGGNLWVKDPTTGIWTAAGASPSRIPNPMGSGPTGPHSMEERDVRGVYSHPPATGGVRPGGVVAADVADAIRIDELRGIKIPYYNGNPSNLDDFILDWEDFAEEVVGEMKGAPRDEWVCRTFPHRLEQDLKEELRDQIREGLIQTEQACLQWPEDEEQVDAPNQKLEDLWSIPLPLERGDHGIGRHPRRNNGVLPAKPRPNVGVEDHRLRGGIRRHHRAKADAPQQRGVEARRMQVIFARKRLDEIVKYITVELKLNAKNEAHVQDRQGHGHQGRREDRQHREVKEDTVGTAEEGS